MSELTMPIMKATTEDLCYTHWFERQMEMVREGQTDTPLFAALKARTDKLLPMSVMAPFYFRNYTTE